MSNNRNLEFTNLDVDNLLKKIENYQEIAIQINKNLILLLEIPEKYPKLIKVPENLDINIDYFDNLKKQQESIDEIKKRLNDMAKTLTTLSSIKSQNKRDMMFEEILSEFISIQEYVDRINSWLNNKENSPTELLSILNDKIKLHPVKLPIIPIELTLKVMPKEQIEKFVYENAEKPRVAFVKSLKIFFLNLRHGLKSTFTAENLNPIFFGLSAFFSALTEFFRIIEPIPGLQAFVGPLKQVSATLGYAAWHRALVHDKSIDPVKKMELQQAMQEINHMTRRATIAGFIGTFLLALSFFVPKGKYFASFGFALMVVSNIYWTVSIVKDYKKERDHSKKDNSYKTRLGSQLARIFYSIFSLICSVLVVFGALAAIFYRPLLSPIAVAAIITGVFSVASLLISQFLRIKAKRLL